MKSTNKLNQLKLFMRKHITKQRILRIMCLLLILKFIYWLGPGKLIFWLTIESISMLCRPFSSPIGLSKNNWQNDGFENQIINHGDFDCHAYGWYNVPKRKVYDVFLFSNELDMLEIRLGELYDSVDKFILIESPTTFSGKPKAMYFDQNRQRYSKFLNKVHYYVAKGLEKIEDKWDREASQRHSIKDALLEVGARHGDLIILSDLDEIPRPRIIVTLSLCAGYESPVYLSLKNYMYSFEWEDIQTNNNKPAVWTYGTPIFEEFFPSKFKKLGSTLIMDAGWHCSWCFKYLDDFSWKMNSYSHYDMFWRSIYKDPEHIQQCICSGVLLWGHHNVDWALNYYHLFAQLLPFKQRKTLIDIPNYLIENKQKFKYLIPGNCIREANDHLHKKT